jgi:Peptidase family M23
MARGKRHQASVLTLGVIIGMAACYGQTVSADEVASPLVATPITAPNPVLGADAKTHLVYEIVLMNIGSTAVGLGKIETLDAIRGTVLGTLEGVALAQMLRLNDGAKGTELSAGGSGIAFMDVLLDKNAAAPKTLKHRFEITVAKTSSPKRNGDRHPAPEPPQEITFVGDPLDVGSPALVVSPPLKGARWLVGGGCCSPYSYHRGATLSINGTIHIAQRYAIDFVQLNDKNVPYSGPRDQLSSYAYFGVEIHSVADGIVVQTADNFPEQVPGKLPEGMTIQMATGNHVIVDIGEGRYAFYAHMQPQSLRVKVGDKVITGQVLGLLGNSGNTDGPHLHFHVMDGPSPLRSNGLPYVFTNFEGQGVLRDEGEAVSIDKSALAGPHQNQLPLNAQVVSFP